MTNSSTTFPASDLKIQTIGWTVAAQVWPLLALAGILLAGALAWMVHAGDPVPAEMAWVLLAKPATLGLFVPFTLHECAHAFLIRRIDTVSHISIERTTWRTSVVPEGSMSPRQAGVVALAGPSACVAVGCPLWLLDRSLAWWYLAHIAFLLPVFGDGRAILFCLRSMWKDSVR